MTLLEPIASISAAAVTIPLLILLYLLKLRRRPLRVSSTLFWQSAVHDLQANVPFRWLRPSWLLFLHLAALGLLVAALGRPAIAPAGGSTRRIVLLIDRSASMGAVDGPDGTTRLDAAKESARGIVGRALDSSGATVALVPFAAEARAEVGFTASRSLLLDSINAVTQTDQPADLTGALKLIESLVAGDQSEGSPPSPATVVLVSDGSFEPGTLALGGARLSFVRIGPAPGGAEGPDNLGIVALGARRDFDDPATVRVFARIRNASRTTREVAVALSLGDMVLDRRAVSVPGASPVPDAAPEDPASGEAATVFELKSGAGGVATVTIERPDLLTSDNFASLLIPSARRARIVLVTPDTQDQAPPIPGDHIASDSLLADAASELDAASFTRLFASQYESISESGRPSAADLYIFDRVRPGILPGAPSLSFGAPVPIPGLNITASAEPTGTYILSWLRTHPALRDVALDSVFVGAPMRIRWSEDAPAVLELATGATGPLIVQVQDGSFRRIVVGFEVARSNWALQVGFPIFLAAGADFLTMRAEESAGKAFTTAQAVEVLPPERVERFALRGPVTVSVEVLPPTPGRPGGGVTAVPVGRLERAGVYRVEPPGPEPFVAVNLGNALETALATRESIEVGGRAVGAAGGGDVAREVWPWFVLAASALLMIEWLVYAWRMRV